LAAADETLLVVQAPRPAGRLTGSGRFAERDRWS
jgi:hypothetical protein